MRGSHGSVVIAIVMGETCTPTQTQKQAPFPDSSSTARIDAALRKVAAAAGIGHVTAHQLRHTRIT
jgi:integrase